MQCVLLYCIVLLFAGFRWHATCSHEFRPNETARSLEKKIKYMVVRWIQWWAQTWQRDVRNLVVYSGVSTLPKLSMRSPNSWGLGGGIGGRFRLKFEESKFSIRLKIWKLPPPSLHHLPLFGSKIQIFGKKFRLSVESFATQTVQQMNSSRVFFDDKETVLETERTMTFWS